MSRAWMNPLTAQPVRPMRRLNAGSVMVPHELITELHETPAAHLLVFVFEGQNIGRWLPKSQIKIPYADVVEIPRWLVDQISTEVRLYGQTDK